MLRAVSERFVQNSVGLRRRVVALILDLLQASAPTKVEAKTFHLVHPDVTVQPHLNLVSYGEVVVEALRGCLTLQIDVTF